MFKTAAALSSFISLVACLAVPVLYFNGAIGEAAYKNSLTVASVAWFVFATTWATRREQ